MTGARPGALSGLRVLDLSQMLAGPYCTMLLADQGADVVKIEPPDGDPARRFGPFHPDDTEHAFGGYFQSVNRGKRSVVLDLKSIEGADAFLRLVDSADVLVENYRHGVMDRLGFGWVTLHARRPRLVYASIRGFGDVHGGVSPRIDWPAYDLTAQAMGGFVGITGRPGDPVKGGPGLGDIFPGVLTTVGILTALHARSVTGVGQYVDVAMYDSVLAMCERIVHQYTYTGVAPGPQGNTHPILCPFDVFEAADGWVSIASPSDAHWRVLCAAIGARELGDDPILSTNEGRVEQAERVRGTIAEWARTRTRADIMELLGGRFPVGVVQDARDIVHDAHVAARSMVVALEHPGVPESLGVAGNAIKLSDAPGGPVRRAPRLGEHTVEVLSEIVSI